MFIRLLVTSILLTLVVQSALTNSSKGQTTASLTKPKQASLYDDYDLTDTKTIGTHVEGSGGGAASLDEYADDEEEEQLSKVTATTSVSTIIRTTVTTTKRQIMTTTTTTTTTTWLKTTLNDEQPPMKTARTTMSSTTTHDADGGEFKDDHEEYADDLEDDAYYNEPTIGTKMAVSSSPPTRYPTPTTRQSSAANHTAPIWVLFSFLMRPPIAAGILAGLAIGIFTSVILLICIIQRYHKREKSHSSYTTGLLYPNQYGYSKSPQEFYA